MRRVNVLVAATLAALIAAPAQAAVELKPYGFVNVTYMESFHRGNNVNNPTSATADNSSDHNGTYGNLDTSSTRFGLKLSGGKGPMDADLSGVIESDFNGDLGSSTSGSTSRAPRIRLAYMQMAKGNHTLLIGQDWTNAFEPIRPVSNIHIASSLGNGAGNLWNRLPQIRWEADWAKGSDTDFVTRVAALRNWTADEQSSAANAVSSNLTAGSGDNSGIPMFQANAELRQKLMGHVFKIGVGGQYRRNKFNTSVAAPAGATSQVNDDLLGSVHFDLPIVDMFEVMGAGFYGHGENAFVSGNSKFISDNGRPDTALARGGWVQGVLKPMAGWRVFGFYGVTDVNNVAGETATNVHRSEWAQGGVIWDVSPELALSVEGGRIHTMFMGGATGAAGTNAGDMTQVGLGAMYKF